MVSSEVHYVDYFYAALPLPQFDIGSCLELNSVPMDLSRLASRGTDTWSLAALVLLLSPPNSDNLAAVLLPLNGRG